MKRKVLALSLSALAFAFPIHASPFSLGLILGEPTGASAAYAFSRSVLADLGAAWSFTSEGGFHLHGDALFLSPSFAQRIEPEHRGALHGTVGIGARLKFRKKRIDGDRVELGPRVPIGLLYRFSDFPLELFLEVALIVNFVPETEADGNGGIGARYQF